MKEKDIQKTVLTFLKNKDIAYIVSMSGILGFCFGLIKSAFGQERAFRIYSHAKSQGWIKGDPDILVLHPKINYGIKRHEAIGGLFIELKTKTGKPTKEQIERMKYLEEKGYECKVPHSADEAIAEIQKYLWE